MWRLVALASLLFTLAIGFPADAKCGTCVESIRMEPGNSGGSAMRLTARSHDGSALPPTGTAILMQFNGERSKCIEVQLRKVDEVDGLGTYVGTFGGTYGGSGIFTGRLDIGGNVHDFSVPLNGAPGTVTLVDVAAPATTAAAPTTAPTTAAPQQAVAPQPARSPSLDLGAFAQQPLVMTGLALAAIALMIFSERRRTLGRAAG